VRQIGTGNSESSFFCILRCRCVVVLQAGHVR
jgi:hypothetical protein